MKSWGFSRMRKQWIPGHFPPNTWPGYEARWLRVFELEESQVKSYSKVCSRHFPGGDAKQDPQVALGKRFASPKKKGTPRAKLVRAREANQQLAELSSSSGRSRSATPIPSSHCASTSSTPSVCIPLSVAIGKQLDQYSILSTYSTMTNLSSSTLGSSHL